VPLESYEIYCPSKLLNHGSSGDSAITMQFADVLHNMSLAVLLAWQQTAFQTFPDILGFSGHLWSSILIFANGASSA